MLTFDTEELERSMRVFSLAALVAAAAFCVLAAAAGADTVGPITFEQPDYTVGAINGQQGWSDTGGFDAAVVSTGGGQALRISDAVTSGSFGDQTFSPGLAHAASESSRTTVDARFSIATTSTDVQPGLHLSVSPDDGTGSRMSYLRFEDQADGVHVFFDDASDAGPLGTEASFSDSDIATLSRGAAHTIELAITLVPGAANDVVKISIDGTLVHTGTTWEDYYRYDPEQAGNGNAVPAIDKLLFREAGDADSADAGGGFLIDDVSLTSAPGCTPTGFVKDGMNLTAAQIGGDVTGRLDATGCNIGVYDGSVHGGEIYGANYYGALENGVAEDVANGNIHDIGERPLNGAQHGVGVEYLNGATGTLSGTTIASYQKNGVVIDGAGTSVTAQGNTVTGQGQIDYIAQNGIQVSGAATALVKGNTVSGNWYTPKSFVACGLLFFEAAGVKQQGNTLFGNEVNLCNAGRGGGNTSAG
jgi:parallel beta helix pectate lyase-like protein